LSTASQLQSQGASVNISIHSATQSLSNATSAYQNTLSTAISNFRKCTVQGGTSFAPAFAGICGGQLASTAVSSISNAVTTAMQPFTQALGLSVNSVTATVIPLVTSTVQTFQQTVHGAETQAANIAQQTQACLLQAASARPDNANPTTMNAMAMNG
jgi:hypothetical protein